MIRFTSLKPPKLDVTLTAPPSQTFHALKSRLAEKEGMNPLAIRLLYKKKAINDSKSLHEVFGEGATDAQLTVMVMKNVPSTASASTASTSSVDASGGSLDSVGEEGEEFWREIRRVVGEKYAGSRDKEEVFEALRKGYKDKFGGA
jgi:hypothetical protein